MTSNSAESSLLASVSEWVQALRVEADESSARKLCDRYFKGLVEVAARRLPKHRRRDFDEEDVALSAFHSFCQGVQGGRFDELSNRNDLWALLTTLTARKAAHRMRAAMAEKRGEGRIAGESVFENMPGQGIDAAAASNLGPAFIAEVGEQSKLLIDALTDDTLVELALLKVSGHSNEEVAQRLSCGVRTVERRLRLIRRIWSEGESSE